MRTERPTRTTRPARRRDICRSLEWRDNAAGVKSVFVREIHGGSAGPTLLVTAGEHGIELSPVGGIDILCRQIARTAFRGTLLAIPCLSPCNIRYRAHTYGETYGGAARRIESYDTSGRWPGRPDGSPAERLCHVVWNEVVSRADAVINFHTWQNSAGCLATDVSVPGAEALARSFGSVFNLLHCDRRGGGLVSQVLLTGRPAAGVETHGQYRIEPDAAERVHRGIRNVMVTLGMIEGPLDLPNAMYETGREHLLYAPTAGLFIPLKALEQATRRGELLGYMLDVETGERTDIASPADGAVWLVARNGPAADVVLQGLHAYADRGDLVALIKEVRPM
jgi:predicted deacylase